MATYQFREATVICDRCYAEVERTSGVQKYCPTCAVEVEKEAKRERQRRYMSKRGKDAAYQREAYRRRRAAQGKSVREARTRINAAGLPVGDYLVIDAPRLADPDCVRMMEQFDSRELQIMAAEGCVPVGCVVESGGKQWRYVDRFEEVMG